MSPTHRETVGLKKLGSPAGFVWYRWEAIGADVILTGCVSSGVITKGARKGRPKYDGPKQQVVVTVMEEDAELARYEAETGECGHCMGDGKEFASWHHINGTTWRECRSCHGSGKRVEG